MRLFALLELYAKVLLHPAVARLEQSSMRSTVFWKQLILAGVCVCVNFLASWTCVVCGSSRALASTLDFRSPYVRYSTHTQQGSCVNCKMKSYLAVGGQHCMALFPPPIGGLDHLGLGYPSP